MHSPARLMRCLLSAFMAVLKPRPGTSPTMAEAGTRQSFRYTSPTGEPCWPILRSAGPVLRPGVPRSIKKALMPCAPGVSGSVRAKTVNRSASGALVIKHLLPLST
ncbi:hypothetical protein D3C86_1271250 [compost metagenome]